MELIPFESWHFEYLALPMPQGQNLGPELVKAYGLAYYTRGKAYTVKHEGQIIGSLGVMDLWPGVGEAWSCMTDDLRKHPFYLHRNTYKIIRRIIKEGGYHRVQSIVCCSEDAPVRWIERLGFVKESVMKGFGSDGTDHAMYVWVMP